MTPIPSLLAAACQGVRLDRLSPFSFSIHPKDEDTGDRILRTIQDSRRITAGKQGHEYLRALGLVQPVFALKLGRYSVRIVGPARSPAGQFSNLRGLERRVTA